MTRNSIYQALLAEAEVRALPPAWGEIPCHSAFVRLPEDMSPVIERLRGTFVEEELVESGVLVKDGDAVPAINPLLTKNRDNVFAVERTGEAGPRQLIAGLRTVGRHCWCVTATLSDPHLSEMVKNFDSRIFIAFSQADLAAAWSIGIPSIPSTLLEKLGGSRLEQFCKNLNLRRTSVESNFDFAGPRGTPIYPVLINWSLAELELKQHSAARVLEHHLLNLQRHLGIDFSDSAVWTPTVEELESIKFRIKYGGPGDVLDALVDSSANCKCFGLSSKPNSGSEPKRYVDAVRDYTVSAAGNDTLRRQKSWERLQQFQEAELITPLMDQAQEERNPVRRTLLTSLAEVSRVFHPQTMLLSTQLAKTVRDQGPQTTAELPAEEFQQFIMLTDRVLAIAQGVQSCRSKKNTTKRVSKKSPTNSNP